jgi:hypothetical protein
LEAPVHEVASPVTPPPAEAVTPSEPNGSETLPIRTRGPRIAQVRMLKPQPQGT